MVHLEYGPDVSVSLQNGYGTSAALQRYLQHRSGLLGQALGTSGPAGGHAVTVGEGLGSEVVVVVDVVGVGVGVVVVVVVVMRQEQADERREVEEAQGAERELGAVVLWEIGILSIQQELWLIVMENELGIGKTQKRERKAKGCLRCCKIFVAERCVGLAFIREHGSEAIVTVARYG